MSWVCFTLLPVCCILLYQNAKCLREENYVGCYAKINYGSGIFLCLNTCFYILKKREGCECLVNLFAAFAPLSLRL